MDIERNGATRGGLPKAGKVYLIAGLGNPGPKYKNTRHNIGFKVVNLWGDDLNVRLTGQRFQSRNTLTRFEGKRILLVRPLTYMNRSGLSVEELARNQGRHLLYQPERRAFGAGRQDVQRELL